MLASFAAATRSCIISKNQYTNAIRHNRTCSETNLKACATTSKSQLFDRLDCVFQPARSACGNNTTLPPNMPVCVPIEPIREFTNHQWFQQHISVSKDRLHAYKPRFLKEFLIEPRARTLLKHRGRGTARNLTEQRGAPQEQSSGEACPPGSWCAAGAPAVAPWRRRVFVDVGANSYRGTIGTWFLGHYPDAASFKVCIRTYPHPIPIDHIECSRMNRYRYLSTLSIFI